MSKKFDTYSTKFGTVTHNGTLYALTETPYLDGDNYNANAVRQEQLSPMSQFQPETDPHYIITWSHDDKQKSEPYVEFSGKGESIMATEIRDRYEALESCHGVLYESLKKSVDNQCYSSIAYKLPNLHRFKIQMKYFPFSAKSLYANMCTFTDGEIIDRLLNHIEVINNTIDDYALEHNEDKNTLYEIEGLVKLKNKIKEWITTYSF